MKFSSVFAAAAILATVALATPSFATSHHGHHNYGGPTIVYLGQDQNVDPYCAYAPNDLRCQYRPLPSPNALNVILGILGVDGPFGNVWFGHHHH